LLDFNRLWIDTQRETDGQRFIDNGGYSWKKLEVHSSQEKKSQKRETRGKLQKNLMAEKMALLRQKD
jgi:hypothetical protein